MPSSTWKTVGRGCRRLARWCRISVLAGILTVLICLVYLNRIGLPDFVKNRLVAGLHERGLDLDFNRVRLHWYRGIEVDQINLGGIESSSSPQLYIDEAEVRLDYSALRHWRLEVRGLAIRRARLVWPLAQADTNAPPLSLEDITTELRFLPNDQWELDRFRARFLGAVVRLNGSLTNASAVRQWRFPQATNLTAGTWQDTAAQIIRIADQLKCPAPPELQFNLRGDARDWRTFSADLALHVTEMASPWMAADKLLLTAWLSQLPSSNGLARIKLNLQADSLRMDQTRLQKAQLSGSFTQTPTHLWPTGLKVQIRANEAALAGITSQNLEATLEAVRGPGTSVMDLNLELNAKQGRSPWADAQEIHLRTHWTQRIPESPARAEFPPRPPTGSRPWTASIERLPVRAGGVLELGTVQSRWAASTNAVIRFDLAPAPLDTRMQPDARWGGWTWLAPFQADVDCQASDIQADSLSLGPTRVTARWRAPDLTISQCQAALYGGGAGLTGRLDVVTREWVSQSRLDFDWHRIASLLPTNSRSWLAETAWEKPPVVETTANLTLPAWTNTTAGWAGKTLATLRLAGGVQVGPARYRGIAVTSVQSHYAFSNRVWSLPDLMISRPEGGLEVAYTGEVDTLDFHWSIRGGIDPRIVEPLLAGESQRRGLEFFKWAEPIFVRGDLWGRWKAPERTGFKGWVAVTNFVFRGEPLSRFTGWIEFTNRFVQGTSLDIRAGEQSIEVPGVEFDLSAQMIYLTNALCRIDPFVVTRAIGPKTTAALSPYQFQDPPTVRVNGSIPVPRADHPDLELEVAGGPFRYWHFNLPQIQCLISWHGDYLVLTNVQASFYGGNLAGNAWFDFSPPKGANFKFQAQVMDANLRRLMADLVPETNKLEGILNGHWIVTQANTEDWQSWHGRGDVQLHDGLIWSSPLFGIFTPVLNSISPGLGNSRATDGTAMFTMTNSVMRTQDLEIRAPAVRLRYNGTVDFEGRVNARMEANLFRDTWLVGRLFSMALFPITKLFEYKVTGTLKNPKSEPLYILPKFLLLPIHPIRTMKDLFTPEPAAEPSKEPSKK